MAVSIWLLVIVVFASDLHGAPASTLQLDRETAALNPEQYGCKDCDGGDMLRQPSTKTTGRGVAIRPASVYMWSGGVIPYEFAPNISMNHSQLIVQQMREMENLTRVNNALCIQFRPKNASDPYFITILNGSGCTAPVGSWGNYVGVRPVSLLDSPMATCMISGIIQHELMHVLGFFHEQSRPDRDTYVNIFWSNILSGYWSAYDKYNDSQVDTLLTPYDYGSVMHYEKDAFAINMSAPAILPIVNASAFIGQRVRLSPIDVLEIQRYYGCVPMPTTTTSTSTTSVTTTTSTTTTSVTSTTTTTTTSTSTTTTTTTSTSTTTTTTTSTTTTTMTATTSVTNTTASTQEERAVTTHPLTIGLAVGIPGLLALIAGVGLVTLCVRQLGKGKLPTLAQNPLNAPTAQSAMSRTNRMPKQPPVPPHQTYFNNRVSYL